jgi:hypothetical protein
LQHPRPDAGRESPHGGCQFTPGASSPASDPCGIAAEALPGWHRRRSGEHPPPWNDPGGGKSQR